MKKVANIIWVFGLLLAFVTPAASADNYPDKSIYCMVPWSAGGGTDTTIRGFLKAAEDYVGVGFNVSNVTGGGGAVGWTELAHSRADGYTIGAVTYDILTHSAKSHPPFTINNFVSLIGISQYPLVLVVKADAPWQTLEQFTKYAKESNGNVKIAIGAIAGSQHQLLNTLTHKLEFKAKPVPFKGGSEMIAAILGDTIEAALVTSDEAKNRPDIKVLAQFGKKRHSDLPDVPTATEVGVDIVHGSFRGLIAPADTPKEVVAYLRDKFNQAWHDEKFLAWANKAGTSPNYMSGEELDEFLTSMFPNVQTALKEINKR